MKKLIGILFILLCVSCMYAQEVDLHYNFREGVKHKFKEKVEVEINASVAGQDVHTTTKSLVEIDENCLIGGDKGKVKQTTTVVLAETDGKNNLEEISEENRVNTVIYEQDKKGKTINLYNEDNVPIEGFDPSKEDGIFPDKKLKIGDTWIWNKSIDGIKIKVNCKLDKLYSKDGVDIAKISLILDDVVKEESDEGMDASETIVKGEGVFYYSINYANDLYLFYNVNFETTIHANMNGVNEEANMKTNYKYTYWRCE